MVKKIILDTDIGSDVDDSYALLYAVKSDDLELKSVTTVYGKTGLRAKLARKLLDCVDCDVPIYAGESNPMSSNYDSVWHTGLEGVGVLDEQDFASSLEDMCIRDDAPQYLIDEIMKDEEGLEIVSIGALTNVARALQINPKIKSKIKHHYIMGGMFSRPNAEHNIACDVGAAQIVFSNDYPKTLIPLDITLETGIEREELYDLKNGDSLQKSVAKLTDVWFDYRGEAFGKGVDSTCMHDPLTLAVINHPELIDVERLNLKVNDKGVITLGGDCTINIGARIDRIKFKKHFLETIYRN